MEDSRGPVLARLSDMKSPNQCTITLTVVERSALLRLLEPQRHMSSIHADLITKLRDAPRVTPATAKTSRCRIWPQRRRPACKFCGCTELPLDEDRLCTPHCPGVRS